MSRIAVISKEVTERQFHRDPLSLPRNRRIDTIPMVPIRVSDIMKLGMILTFLVGAVASCIPR